MSKDMDLPTFDEEAEVLLAARVAELEEKHGLTPARVEAVELALREEHARKLDEPEAEPAGIDVDRLADAVIVKLARCNVLRPTGRIHGLVREALQAAAG